MDDIGHLIFFSKLILVNWKFDIELWFVVPARGLILNLVFDLVLNVGFMLNLVFADFFYLPETCFMICLPKIS